MLHFRIWVIKMLRLLCCEIKNKCLLCLLVVRVPGYRSWGSGFHSRGYQIFWEVVGLEWGSLSLVSKIEELIGRNSSGSGLENREYGSGDPLHWARDTLYPQKLALRRHAAVARSVQFACWPRPQSMFCLFVIFYVILYSLKIINTS
jgi:hypothetical protein